MLILAQDNEETTVIGFRTRKSLKTLMEKYVLKDTHLNISDFIRDAVREKIKRDYPDLLKELFGEGGN